MTDIRTAAQREAERRWPDHMGKEDDGSPTWLDYSEDRANFVENALWGASRVTARKIVNATLYVMLAVMLVAIGYCIAGAVGELNVRYVPYVEVEHGDDNVKLLPLEPIEVKAHNV